MSARAITRTRPEYALPARCRAALYGQRPDHAADGLRQDLGPRLVQEQALPRIPLGHGRQGLLRRCPGLRATAAQEAPTLDADPADRGYSPALLRPAGLPGPPP